MGDDVKAGLLASWRLARRQPETPVTVANLAGALLAETGGETGRALLMLEDVKRYLELVAAADASAARKTGT